MIASIADRFGGVVLATVAIGIPLGIAVVLLLVRWRVRRGRDRSWAWRASIAEVGLVVGTAPWIWMIMTPSDRAGGVRLLPFRDLEGMLTGRDAVVQVVGNLLAFAAMGCFLPMRFRLGRAAVVPLVVAAVAAGCSAVLETLQFVLQLGRVSSIDDVILNALGGALASLVTIRWWRVRQSPTTFSKHTE